MTAAVDDFELDETWAARRAEAESALARILAIVSALAGLGVVLVYSASCVRAGIAGNPLFFVQKQVAWLGAGAICLFVFSRIDYRWLARLWWLFLLISLGMLAAVLVPGIGCRVNGAMRWMRPGGFNMQPSEFAKLGLLVPLAALVARTGAEGLPFFRGFVPGAVIIGLGAGLIAIEPDFGSAALVATVLAVVLVAGGARLWQLFLLGSAGVPPLVYIGLTKFSYIESRVAAWLAGSSDGKGYQPFMSKVALGSGGPFGLGLGEGTAKLYYLPDAHTDFILAIAGQELGLLGTLSLIALYAYLLREGLRLAGNAADRLGAILTCGIIFMIVVQAVFNIAVVTGSIPPKGISLPLVSFGGSGLCVTLAGIGILCSVVRHYEPPSLIGKLAEAGEEIPEPLSCE